MRIFLLTLFVSLQLLFPLAASAESANLVTNPGAETDTSTNPITGWTTILNGGDGMKVNWDNTVRTGTQSFQTSYSLDSVSQTIDLLNSGYNQSQLNSLQPQITAGIYVSTRGDQAGQYYITYKLLAADGETVLSSSDNTFGTSSSLLSMSSGTDWTLNGTGSSYTFTSYGTGARYAYIEFGGRDQGSWGGNFGTHFDDASITIATTDSIPEFSTIIYTFTILIGAAFIFRETQKKQHLRA